MVSSTYPGQSVRSFRQDDIVVADMVAYMEEDMVAFIEVDTVADMVTDMEVDMDPIPG